MSGFDPRRVIEVLADHGVAYVLIGGLAAIAHGSSLVTRDIDVTPRADDANLDRLAAALRELGARLRVDGDPDGVPFPIEAGFLAAQPHMLHLVTDAGDVDLTLTPSGFPNGYEDLIESAVALDLGAGVQTDVAALEDIIASKEAAGRPKDQMALPYLRALLEERDR